MEVLKVSAKSNPNSVAGALAGVLRERGAAEMQAIGAGALNQAVKAVAIARGFVAPHGVDLICIPAFTDIVIDGEERTAMKLIIEPRQKFKELSRYRDDSFFYNFCIEICYNVTKGFGEQEEENEYRFTYSY